MSSHFSCNDTQRLKGEEKVPYFAVFSVCINMQMMSVQWIVDSDKRFVHLLNNYKKKSMPRKSSNVTSCGFIDLTFEANTNTIPMCSDTEITTIQHDIYNTIPLSNIFSLFNQPDFIICFISSGFIIIQCSYSLNPLETSVSMNLAMSEYFKGKFICTSSGSPKAKFQ